MRVFVTGATGFIGSALVKDLIAAGHQVIGLCRDPGKAPSLAADGAEVLAGSIEDESILAQGVERADGVVHLAFNHDFSRFVANCEDDRRVIKALGARLGRKHLIVTSGTAMANTVPGEPAKEDNAVVDAKTHPRAASEEAANTLAANGASVSIVRLPQVHDPERQGLLSPMIQIWRQQNACAFVGDGANRWPAGPVQAVAQLYRLAMEKATPGAKYHAVAEEGVTLRDMAEAVGRRLNLPVRSVLPKDAETTFGWLAMFAGLDFPASSEQTRQRLGWEPKGPTLLEDLERLPVEP